MKSFVFSGALLACLLLVQAHHHFELNDHDMVAAHDECQKNDATRVTAEVTNQLFSGVYPSSPLVRAHMLCYSKQLGLQSADGSLLVNDVEEKLARAKTPEEAHRLTRLCSVEKDTPEETAYYLFKCWTDNNVKLTHGKI